MVKQQINKKIISRFEAIRDIKVKNILLQEDSDFCSLKFIKEHEKTFKELMPTYYDKFIENYHGWDATSDIYVSRKLFMAYMCLETQVVDTKDFRSVTNFLTAGIDVRDLEYSAPSSAELFLNGFLKLKDGDKLLLDFIEKNPEYLRYFLPLLCSIESDFLSKALSAYLESAKLQDTLRIHILEAMLRTTNVNVLLHCLDEIEKHNYYRFKALNEVATLMGDYTNVLPPKELVAVLKDAAYGNYEGYLSADFRHAYHFLNAYNRLHKKEFFSFAREVFKRGEKRARWALLDSLSFESVNKEYASMIFTSQLTLEDLSFFIYRIDSSMMDSDILPIAFESLYTLLNQMNKVSYHFKTDTDITFAREVSKADLVFKLGSIAVLLNDLSYVERLDNNYFTLKEEAQAKYLQVIGKKTKLDVRLCVVRFLKTDNYEAINFYDEQRIKLTYDEAILVSEYLKTKKESIKSKIIKEYLISKDKIKIMEYLTSCKEDFKINAGLEMQKSIGKIDNHKIQRKTERFKWQTESFFVVDKPIDEIKKIASQNINLSITPPVSYEQVEGFFNGLKKFIDQHRDYEYATIYTEGLVSFGSCFSRLKDSTLGDKSFAAYPLGNEIKAFIQMNFSQEVIAGMMILLHCVLHNYIQLYTSSCYKKYKKELQKVYEYVNSFDRGYFVMNEFTMLRSLEYAIVIELLDDQTKLNVVNTFAQEDLILKYEKNSNEYEDKGYPVIFCNCLSESSNPEILRALAHLECRFIDANITEGFSLELTEKTFEVGLISEKLAAYFLLKIGYLGNLFLPTSPQYVMRSNYENKKFKTLLMQFIEAALNEEFNRGSLQTPYSYLLVHLGRFYGIETFFKALSALRGLTWVRSFYGNSKNEVLSYILKNCIKTENDTYESFLSLIKEYQITNEELMRATLFNPEFVDFVAKYLNIPHLKLAIFWFIAHLNESLYGDRQDRRIEQIKEFSDISYLDFKDGAFDYQWYQEMIEKVPRKVLNQIYKDAKYITVGGLHKRAQRFFDAMNGQITKEECLEKINQTRNKDYCLIYSLVPIENKDDLYERYSILSEFVRQSKQFGAQRQLSERRTVDIALENLARAAQYASTELFIFEMEAQTPSDIFNEYRIDDIIIAPYVDDVKYKIGYKIEKNGKQLSSIPTKYSKDEIVIKLREQVKLLNHKLRRIITSFEAAMNNHICFTADQLSKMCREKLILILLSKLVFLTGNTLCIFDGELKNIDGQPISEKTVFIAHAVELKKKGLLKDAIKYIAKKNIRQPFKQVLREIYSKTELELTQDEVLRFKGFEVDIKKCVGALKGKGWSISEDIGLRKVYYHTDSIAAIFRECDFMYSIDLTNINRELHGIFFLKRKDGEVIPIKNVDDITYSETLRDVDLMISISSKVIYDFELAMSTIEVRHEVLKSIIGLLDLQNVSFLKDNIKIEGAYGIYTINIRTGLVFKEGKGNLSLATVYSIDKPILLDFIDEDPLTADIISKAVILAKDNTIKDPAILFEIKD